MPIEVTCEWCGAKMMRYPSHIHGHVWCSRACAAEARWKGKERQTRRMRKAPGHPIAPPSGLVAEARAVLYDKVGPGPHPCHWCGVELDWVIGKKGTGEGKIVADHLNEDPMNDSPENVVVACGQCNTNRNRHSLVRDDESFIIKANGNRVRVGELRICKTCGTEFTTTESHRNYCSRSCSPSRANKRRAT